MLRINIDQQPAKLHLKITDPSITIRTRPARLDIQTEAAVVEIRQPRGILEIDQSPCRASYGFKKLAQQIRDFAQAGKQAALEATAKYAADGDRMARIETGENVIAALAKESTVPKPLEVGIVPVARPYIRYRPQPVEYRVIPGKITGQYQPPAINIQLNRGTVNGYMAQYQSIRLWTTGSVDFSA